MAKDSDNDWDDSLEHEIPAKLPVVPLSLNSGVIFPKTKFHFRFKLSSFAWLGRCLEDSPYVILAHVVGGRLFPVGVLGKTEAVHQTDEGELVLSAYGLTRVQYSVLPPEKAETSPESGSGGGTSMPAIFAGWNPLPEVPSPEEISQSEEARNLLAAAKTKFDEFVDFIIENLDLSVDENDIDYEDRNANSVENLLSEVVERSDDIDASTLSAALDAMANLLNQIDYGRYGIEINLTQPSLVILREPNILVRANVLLLLMLGIRGNLTEHLKGDEASSDTSVEKENINKNDAENSAPSGQEAERIVAKDSADPVLPKEKDDTYRRVILQEDLYKLRVIKPRFGPLPPFPDDISQFERLTVESGARNAFQQNVIDFLNLWVVDQEIAKDHEARKLDMLRLGLLDPTKPVVGGFFPGPTRVGKTHMVRALALYLCGDPYGYRHISCNNLKDGHQITYLLGAPPMYVGYGDAVALSQWGLDKPHFLKQIREKYGNEPKKLEEILGQIRKYENALHGSMKRRATDKLIQLGWKPGEHPAVMLWDEFERAHPDIHDPLMSILDDGRIQLLNGETVLFLNTMFFMTSNIYGPEIAGMLTGRHHFGFLGENSDTFRELDQKIYTRTLAAVEKFFEIKPALFARIQKENVIVFHPLAHEHLHQILEEMELPALAERLNAGGHNLMLYASAAAKSYIVREASDSINQALGAQAVRSVLERRVLTRLADFLGMGGERGISSRDEILIDTEIIDDNGGPKEKIVIKRKRNQT